MSLFSCMIDWFALQTMSGDKKKIMLLGGLRYLLPVIEVAHKLGLHVITCDYLPDNIAHKYSDEYHNVSIIDKEAVLHLARKLEIDGIMSFAVDPGVVTAAYVQEQMGLPSFGPYESVCILQDKARFREFLRKHRFNCPWSYGFDSVEAALAAAEQFTYPAIVKPTDAAGSKGVSRINNVEELVCAVKDAMKASINGHIIVEEFIEKQGCSSGSECFAKNGKLIFTSYASQRFDLTSINPYVPAGTSWPSSFTVKQEEKLSADLQRLITLLGMNTTIFNVEVRISRNGEPYIMEVSPRGGGNCLAEVLELATGAPLIENAVRACVGLDLKAMPSCEYSGNWLLLMLHSKRDGIYESLWIHPDYEQYVVSKNIWVQHGDYINAFRGANNAIGCLFFKCETTAQVEYLFRDISAVVKVVLK